MCGVAAIVREGGNGWMPDDRARMRRTLAALSPRGPDGEGCLETRRGDALLGHRRLAIQDLSDAASQPMTAADGSLSLVYNGEIYNAPRLRERLIANGCEFRTRSDTEVLLHALDRWGLAGTLDQLRGMFSFVAVSERAGETRVMAAVDHAGMKPLAWRFQHARGGHRELVLASTCDSLRTLVADRLSIDPRSMLDVLSIGYCPAPRTMWSGVRKLAAGTCLEWRVGDTTGPRVRRWWSPPEATQEHASSDTEAAELLGVVAREHLIGDVPVGMFLSGGLDSISLALALRSGGADLGGVRAFTLATGDASDEDAIASDVSGRVGMPWTRVPFGQGELPAMLDDAARVFDEPQGYTALLTAAKIAAALRQHAPDTRVVLGGDGGDEAFGGYAWHRDGPGHPLGLAAFSPASGEAIREHERLAGVVREPSADEGARAASLHALGRLSFTHRYLVRTFGGFHPAEAAALLGVEPSGWGSFADWLAEDDRPGLPSVRRVQRLDVTGFCPGSILPKLDRACMAMGLELRAPFLDRRVLECGLARPVAQSELAPKGSKPPLRRLVSRGIEDGRVPPGVLERRKQGFSLRLPDGAFEQTASAIEDSPLVSDGLLRPDWRRYLTTNAEMRQVRLFTLAFIASWYTHRAHR